MIFKETKLTGSYIVDMLPLLDERGWFARAFCKDEFNKIGFRGEWVQLNHSFTNNVGTIRGMHYQLPPFGEIKLVRCIAGAVLDVIIDVRKNSNTFLQWVGTELTAENKKMIYIPEGFAHGFQTLTDNCQVLYHHSQFYKPGAEGGIRYDDPKMGIKWPNAVLKISKRDEEHPYLDKNFDGIKI